MKPPPLPPVHNKGLSAVHRLASAADYLTKITHFTGEECKVLLYLHQNLETVSPLDRMRVREVLHIVFEITDDIMLDLAFKAFDRNNDGFVDDIEWVQGLSTMLRGTTDELSEWCYFIYDMNGDGGLAREELAHCLKGCILPGFGVDNDEIEDCERDVVEIVMRKLDVDKDGQITLEDFKQAVKLDPLLLVAVGPCLPPVKCCAGFMSLITEKFRTYTGALGRSIRKKHVSHNVVNRYQSLAMNATYQDNRTARHSDDPSAAEQLEKEAKLRSKSIIVKLSPEEMEQLLHQNRNK